MVLAAKPDLVVLAGWMHVFGDGFLDIMGGSAPHVFGSTSDSDAPEEALSAQDLSSLVFPIPVINLHPALPGQFDGANAIDRAWDAYQSSKTSESHFLGKVYSTGVMVHRVVRQVDAGEPILVEKVPFMEGESKKQFEERLHGVEWRVIVWATEKVLKERAQQRWAGSRG